MTAKDLTMPILIDEHTRTSPATTPNPSAVDSGVCDARLWPTIAAMQELGREYHGRSWSLGTSSNYSVVLTEQPLRLLITASGKHKDRLRLADFVIVDELGAVADESRAAGEAAKPSAETLLHLTLVQERGARAVLHTHSVAATVLSDLEAERGALVLENYEMLKGLAGVRKHDTRVDIPIFENSQDMQALAAELSDFLRHTPRVGPHGFLLRGHGLYTWGADLAEARRHIEVLEFLFEVELRKRSIGQARSA